MPMTKMEIMMLALDTGIGWWKIEEISNLGATASQARLCCQIAKAWGADLRLVYERLFRLLDPGL